MPTVAIPQGALRSVMPTGGLEYQHIQASPESFGSQVGQAEQRLGGSFEQASDVAAKHAIAFQELKNETMAKEADIKASKAMADVTSEYFSSMGKNAVDGFDPTVAKTEEIRKQHLEALPNESAKKMFDQAFYRNMTYNINAMSRHAATQNKVWMIDTSKAREDSAISSAMNYYNDDAKFGQAVETAKQEAYSRVELQFGAAASPEIVRQEYNRVESKAWTARIQRTMIQEPVAALDMYRANIDKIDGAQHAQLEHILKSATDPVFDRKAAEAIISGRPPAPVAPIINEVEKEGGLFTAMEATESNGKPGAVSPKGALGVMQLMPDTARDVAKKLGIPFDEKKLTENTPEGIAYNRALGQEYYRRMSQRYGGNQTLALAAYNAGPKRVDEWVAKYGNPNQGHLSDAEWADRIPFKETREYVAKINARVPAPQGTPATSIDVRAQLPQWVAEADKIEDPVRRDAVAARIHNYVNTIATAQVAVEKQSRDTLVRGVINGNLDLDSMQRAPQWAGIDGASQAALMSMATHKGKGKDPELTNDALYAYHDAMGRASRDPQGFKDEKLDTLFNLLPHHLTLQLINLQAAIEKKDPSQMDKAAQIGHAKEVAAPTLRAAGIDPHAKVGSPKAKAYDQFVGRLQDSVDQYVANNKKKPTDDDIRGMTNSLLTQGVQPGGSWWGMGDKNVRAFEVDPGAFKVVAPPDQVKQIRIDYKKIKGTEPSQSEIDRIYTASQLRKK